MVELLFKLLDRIGYENLRALIRKNQSLLSFLKTMPGWINLEITIKGFKGFINLDEVNYDNVVKFLKEQKKDYWNIISNEPGGTGWLRYQVADIRDYLRKL